jgi:acyl-coenzyme A thioesterase PaaI-like protein
MAQPSLVDEVLVLTIQSSLQLIRPVSSGEVVGEGRVVRSSSQLWFAESVLYDSEERELTRGSGVFTRSKMRLDTCVGYPGQADVP